jgi:hypothetical protein
VEQFTLADARRFAKRYPSRFRDTVERYEQAIKHCTGPKAEQAAAELASIRKSWNALATHKLHGKSAEALALAEKGQFSEALAFMRDFVAAFDGTTAKPAALEVLEEISEKTRRAFQAKWPNLKRAFKDGDYAGALEALKKSEGWAVPDLNVRRVLLGMEAQRLLAKGQPEKR